MIIIWEGTSGKNNFSTAIYIDKIFPTRDPTAINKYNDDCLCILFLELSLNVQYFCNTNSVLKPATKLTIIEYKYHQANNLNSI